MLFACTEPVVLPQSNGETFLAIRSSVLCKHP